ncbi:MAG: GNAT family N-acetyltransferase, partial [Spartobacteria bacterium]|nr:GNAT family N-acetyltransferase [Spartobacteria bacterium]
MKCAVETPRPEEVRTATVADAAALLATMNSAFTADDPSFVGFETLLPDLYQPTEACMGCHRLLRDGGTITSSAGIYPVDVRIGDIRLRVAGIGGVATHPAYRGSGGMTTIMKAVWAELYESGYALSWLSGDRLRYSRFGWETAGSAFELSLADPGTVASTPAWVMAPIAVNRDSVAAFYSLYERCPVRGIATPTNMLWKLRRHGVTLWKATRGGEVAFMALNETTRAYCAWAGHPDGVQALALHFLRGKQHWKVCIPAVRDVYTDGWLGLAAYIQHAHANLAIIDLARLFREYEPWMRGRWPEALSVKFT